MTGSDIGLAPSGRPSQTVRTHAHTFVPRAGPNAGWAGTMGSAERIAMPRRGPGLSTLAGAADRVSVEWGSNAGEQETHGRGLQLAVYGFARGPAEGRVRVTVEKIKETNPDTRHPRAPCWGRERSPGKPWAQTGLRRLLGVKTQSQKSTWSSRGPAPGPRFTQNLSQNR